MNRAGRVRLGSGLAERIPEGCDRVHLAWDADTGRLRLTFSADFSNFVPLLRDGGHRSRRIYAKPALRDLGLIGPDQSDIHTFPAKWVDGAIIVETRPAVAEEPVEEIDDAQYPDDDGDDELTADEALTSLPMRRTCELCRHRIRGTCYWQGSPRAFKLVGAGEPACEYYHTLPAQKPRRAKPPPREPPAGDIAVDWPDPVRELPPDPPAWKQREIAFRKRGRVRCAVCGSEHARKKDSRPWPHDCDGVDYRAGHGNRNKPCPGNHSVGKAV